jgi:uncharacterized protein YhaN
MQIKKINLLRYGHFEDRELDFADSGLTIIYGPNEAGKSTSLSAIADLLYGFDRLCPYNFKFEYSKLRLGGTLTNRAGDQLSFHRRKANSATIMDTDGTPLPDSVLGPYLGQSDKEFFNKSFGLSHTRLREGGEAIGEAGGDLGKILFEAGSGITNLAEIQKKLEDQAGEIFSSRRGNTRLLYQSLTKYEEAAAALKEATLKQQDWQNAQRELAGARENLERVRGQLHELTARQAKLNRWLRVLPILREINNHQTALDELGPLVSLPEDARQKYQSAITNHHHAQSSISEIRSRLDELEAQVEECAVDQSLLDAGDRIQRLYENVASIEQQVEELPLLETNIAELKRQMSRQADRLNLPTEDGHPLLPKQPDITSLSSLVTQRQQLDTRLRKLTEDEAVTAAQVAQLEQKVAALTDVTDPGPDGAILNKLQTAMAGLPDSGKLQREIAKLDKKIAAALATLSWWTGDAESLLKLKLPSKAQIEQHRKAIDRAKKDVESQAEKLEDAMARLKDARRKLDSFQKRESIYSDADLSQAREKRQDAWVLVRRVLDEKIEPSAEEIARFDAGNAIALVFEKLSERADEVADARFDSAEKVLKHQTLQENVEASEQQLSDMQGRLDKASAELDAALSAWNDLWDGTGITPEAPEIMAESLQSVEAIREAVAAREETAAERTAATQAEEKLRQQLQTMATRLGIETSAETNADVLTVQMENALSKRVEAFRQAETLHARQAEQKQMHEKHKRDIAQLNQELAAWQEKWGGCCSQVKLSPQLDVVQVTEAVSAWTELAQNQGELENRQADLQQTDIRIRQFVEAASALAKSLKATTTIASAADAIASVRGMYSGYNKMLQLATRRAELERQVLETKDARERHEQAIMAAKADISSLMELAGVEKDDDLPAAIDTAENQRHIQAEIEASRKRLLEASEGEDDESLASSVGEISLDDVRAELDGVSGEIESLKNDLETASSREADARRMVADLEAKSGAAEHAQAMQNAVARMAVQARDYLRLQAASTLLRHGIERVRDKHKNPILTKASEFFKTVTSNSFSGLTTDYDKNGSPIIVGVRANGEQLEVAGMSEGTRDQLYLALRLAFVENYCATEEPLPFIGDDLFINFDDERTAAGLQLLSQLEHCQVVLFTHHEHVINLAKAELGVTGGIHYLDLRDPDPVRL